MKAPPPHAYVHDPDIAPTHDGQTWCYCGQLQSNPRHDLPVQADDVTAAEARRLGEKE